jgi:hypothetical protein
LKEINAIAHGHSKAQEKADIRMRRGWMVFSRSMGNKQSKEENLWPMQIDLDYIEEVKQRNYEHFDSIKEFANLKGKPKQVNGSNNR